MKKIIHFSFLLFSLFDFSQNTTTDCLIAFYNVENLFDPQESIDYIDGFKDSSSPLFHRSIPIDSLPFVLNTKTTPNTWSDKELKNTKTTRELINSKEFTQQGNKRQTKEIYQEKLENIAFVLRALSQRKTKKMPAIIGLTEIENRDVLLDLLQTKPFDHTNYGILHYESFDARGIDTALLYQKDIFMPQKTWKKQILYKNKENIEYSRDILIVQGLLLGQKVTFFVNHWPSRRGSQSHSEPKRIQAAQILKNQMDSIRIHDPEQKLIAMGDFNDNPTDISIKNTMLCVEDINPNSPTLDYYNPMIRLYKKGVASLAYRDEGNLFDQFFFSPNCLLLADSGKKIIQEVSVFTSPFLLQKDGMYRGYPFRSWSGDNFTGGYSDHLPIYCVLSLEK